MIFFKSENLIWTQHSLAKLRQYQLSASRVLRILRHPDRKEIGIVPKTEACMQKSGSKKHPYEIWVMYQLRQKAKQTPKPKLQITNKMNEVTIISAWRYPGVSPIHEPPPIPEE